MRAPRRQRLAALGPVGVLLVTALLVGASACSSGGSNGSPTTTSAAGAEPVVWKVCSDIPFHPFEYPGTGPRGLKDTGFDIDLLDAIAKDQGATLHIVDADFDTIFPQLDAGRCEVVASAVTIDDDATATSRLSDPYYDADQTLVVPKGSAVTQLDDLAGKVIGAETGSAGARYAKAKAPDTATIREYPDAESIFRALRGGSIDAAVQDLAVNSDRADKDPSVKVVATIPTREEYGFAVAPDNRDLQRQLDAGLAAVKDDGTYDRLYAKYFPHAG